MTNGVSIAFGLLAGSLLGVALLMPNDSKRSVQSPLGLLLGRQAVDGLSPLAWLPILTWVGALIWVIVGLTAPRTRPRTFYGGGIYNIHDHRQPLRIPVHISFGS